MILYIISKNLLLLASTYQTCLLKTGLLQHDAEASAKFQDFTYRNSMQRNVYEYMLISNVSPGPLVEKPATVLKQ